MNFIQQIKEDPATAMVYRDGKFVLTSFKMTGLGIDEHTIRYRASKVRGVHSIESEFPKGELPENVTACFAFSCSDPTIRNMFVDIVIDDSRLLLGSDKASFVNKQTTQSEA